MHFAVPKQPFAPRAMTKATTTTKASQNDRRFGIACIGTNAADAYHDPPAGSTPRNATQVAMLSHVPHLFT